MDYSAMVAAILATYGEALTVTVGGTPHTVTAAFLAPYQGATVAGVPINRPDPEIVARAADWIALAAAPGDTVARGATVYTIVDNPKLDAAGFVTVKLRIYS